MATLADLQAAVNANDQAIAQLKTEIAGLPTGTGGSVTVPDSVISQIQNQGTELQAMLTTLQGSSSSSSSTTSTPPATSSSDTTASDTGTIPTPPQA